MGPALALPSQRSQSYGGHKLMGGKAFMLHHDRHPGNTSSGCPESRWVVRQVFTEEVTLKEEEERA